MEDFLAESVDVDQEDIDIWSLIDSDIPETNKVRQKQGVQLDN